MPRRLRRLATAVTALAVGLGLLTAPAAQASGTAGLHPTDVTCAAPNYECRAAIEWRTSTYGPDTDAVQIRRRTLFSVYAQAGEDILLGSSAMGVGAADITVWNPGVVTDPSAVNLPAVTSGANGFLCSTQRANTGTTSQGLIATRAQEKAGPQALSGGGNPTGYVPCSYTAPVTGIYRVGFYGPAGAGTDGNAPPNGKIEDPTNPRPWAAPNAAGPNGGEASVAAWDITLRSGANSTTAIPGRVYTLVLAGYTGGSKRTVDLPLYVTTRDGYRYRVQTRTIEPNGFVLYGNRDGFHDADGSPLNHDILTTGALQQQLKNLQGGVRLAPPEFPLSLEPLAPETLTALGIPTAPTAPNITGLTFAGAAAAGPGAGYVTRGGTFTLTASTPGTYEVVISRNGINFDPGVPTNATLRGAAGAGNTAVAWDGKDNEGNAFPVASNYTARAVLKGGEYHLPMLDIESATQQSGQTNWGPPVITLDNPPGGVCPAGGCSRVYYDDRGYTTSNGTDVGTPGGDLCPAAPAIGAPTVNHSDPVTGYDSTGTQRAFGRLVTSGTSAGTTTGGTNTACDTAPAASFGDAMGLDLWTHYPTGALTTTVGVVALPAPPTAGGGHREHRLQRRRRRRRPRCAGQRHRHHAERHPNHHPCPRQRGGPRRRLLPLHPRPRLLRHRLLHLHRHRRCGAERHRHGHRQRRPRRRRRQCLHRSWHAHPCGEQTEPARQ